MSDVIQVTIPTDGDVIAAVLPQPTVVQQTGGGGSFPASAAGWLHDDGTGTRGWSTPTAAQVGADTAAARDTAISTATAPLATSSALTSEAATRAAADTTNASAIAAETSRAQGVEAGKADLSGPGSTVPRNQLPNISGSFWQQVANQAAMLALTAPDADTALVVFRTDTPGTVWFLNPGLNPATLGNWGSYQDDAAGAAAAAQTAAIAAAATDATTKANNAVTTAETYADRYVGSAAGTASRPLAATDATTTNARTPTAHAASHASGGTDAVTLAESQITGLVADLAAKQPLDADLTGLADPTSSAGTLVSDGSTWLRKTAAQFKTWLGLVAADIPTIAESQVTNLTTDLAAKIPLTQRAAANGVATLDSSGLVPVSQLPTSTAPTIRSTTGAPTVLTTDIVGDFAFDAAAGIMYGPLATSGSLVAGDNWIAGANGESAPLNYVSAASEPQPLTGCLGATVPRNVVNNATLTAAATGIIRVAGRWFYAGQVIGHLDWLSGTTAAVTPTHSYMLIANSSGVVLASTADNLTLALPASTVFNWAIATVAGGAGSSYTIPATGFYYLGVSVSAATVPTYSGTGLGITALTGAAPIASAVVTGASATPPAVGTTMTIGGAQGQVPWFAAFT